MDHFYLDLVFCLGHHSNIRHLEFSLCRRWNARNVIELNEFIIRSIRDGFIKINSQCKLHFRCSFDNFTSDWYHKSFIMASFWCQYGFHIFIIACLYYYIVKAVLMHKEELQRQAEKMNVNISSLINKPDQELVFAEYHTAKVVFVNMTLWAITWTPFKLNAIIGTWHSPAFIDPLTSELPILMSITSAMCSPIVYALIHPKYRKVHLKKKLWCKV